MESMRLSRLNVLATGLILVLLIQAAGVQQVRYVYDDLGRLIAVMDEHGRTAIYEYGEVGSMICGFVRKAKS
jgi:YD repeat-containing protein